MHTAGLDIRHAFSSFGYWLEGIYSFTEGFYWEDYWNRSPILDIIGGFDVRFGKDQMGYANLQLRGRYLPHFDVDYYATYPGGSPDILKIGDEAYMIKYYQRTFLHTVTEYRERLLTGLMFKLACEKTIKASLDGACFVLSTRALFSSESVFISSFILA